MWPKPHGRTNSETQIHSPLSPVTSKVSHDLNCFNCSLLKPAAYNIGISTAESLSYLIRLPKPCEEKVEMENKNSRETIPFVPASCVCGHVFHSARPPCVFTPPEQHEAKPPTAPGMLNRIEVQPDPICLSFVSSARRMPYRYSNNKIK